MIMKKIFRILCITFFLMIFTMTAGAAHWKWITFTKDFVVYYDRDSVSMKNGIIDVWVKNHYPNPKNNVSNTIGHGCFHLNNKTARVLSITDYEKNGKVIYSHLCDKYESEYQPLIPGTIGWTIMETLIRNFSYRV